LSTVVHEWDTEYSNIDTNRLIRAGMSNALLPHGLGAPECWLTPALLPEPLRSPHHTISTDQVGYDLCKLLFKTHRPDGLVVYTDIFAKGVFRALEEMGVKAGEDIQVVVMGNFELDFPWLSKAIRLDLSIDEVASSLIALAEAGERKEPPKDIRIKRRLNLHNDSQGALA